MILCSSGRSNTCFLLVSSHSRRWSTCIMSIFASLMWKIWAAPRFNLPIGENPVFPHVEVPSLQYLEHIWKPKISSNLYVLNKDGSCTNSSSWHKVLEWKERCWTC